MLIAQLATGGASAEGSDPAPPIDLLVRLRAVGPHAVTECAEARERSGQGLAAVTRDASDSLDRLHAELGVRAVRALFRRSDGRPFAAQRAALKARAHARRSALPAETRAALPPVPELAHVYRLRLPPGTDAVAAAARYRADPHVVWAQPSFATSLDLAADDPFLASSGSWGQPYQDLWGILRIGAPAAWDLSQGEGIVVAVVDTGIDTAHPDLAANLWVNPGEDLDRNGRVDPGDRNGQDDDGNGFIDDLNGFDFANSVDADGDGDFDAWMVNYQGKLDRMLRNDSGGHGPLTFTRKDAWIVGDPFVDELEVAFGDYDGDGDLDLLVANFSGTNWIYQSGLAQGLDPDTQGIYHRTGFSTGGSLAGNFPEMPTTADFATSLDAAWGDMDGDGDLDGLVANDLNGSNRLYTNALGIPDVHAPGFYKVTAAGAPPAGQPVVIHAQARENAPPELHVFYAARLVYAVDAGAPVSMPMFAQGGQQYRGVIPAQVGTVEYHVEVDDLAANTGVSATLAYVQGEPGAWTDLGFALAGLVGEPSLTGTGTLAPGSPGTLTLSDAAPTASAGLFLSLASTPTPFKGGTLVPVPATLLLPVVTTAGGSIPLAWASWPAGLPAATSIFVQYAIADAGAPAGVALSNALHGLTP